MQDLFILTDDWLEVVPGQQIIPLPWNVTMAVIITRQRQANLRCLVIDYDCIECEL
jgi:hypothetical protein